MTDKQKSIDESRGEQGEAPNDSPRDDFAAAFADDPFFSDSLELAALGEPLAIADVPEAGEESSESSGRPLSRHESPPPSPGSRPRYQPPTDVPTGDPPTSDPADENLRRQALDSDDEESDADVTHQPSDEADTPVAAVNVADTQAEIDTDPSVSVVRSHAQRGLARWRERVRKADGRLTLEHSLREAVEGPAPAEAPREVTRTERVNFADLGLPEEEVPAPSTADVASLGEIGMDDIDQALANLEVDLEEDASVEGGGDPFEASGLFVIDSGSISDAREPIPEFTARLEARLPGLSEELDLPAPWSRYIVELKPEILGCKVAPIRAAYIHEAADVLRLTGDRWRDVAYELDGQALDLRAVYLPALRARLVEAWHRGEMVDYEQALRETIRHASSTDLATDLAASAVVADLHLELGTVYEGRGDRPAALESYLEAARVSQRDPFYFLNLARVFATDGDVGGYQEVITACAALVGEGVGADESRALLLADVGEALRRQGEFALSLRFFQEALDADPTLTSAYRSLQLLGWAKADLDVEIEGLKGQLAVMVDVGSRLERGAKRRKQIKRRAAARFFRLGRLLQKAGAHTEAVTALGDALGIRRHELVYLRALIDAAQAAEDWSRVDDCLTRLGGLLADPAQLSLLLVEQAWCRLHLDDQTGARAHLVRALDIAPDCLPARLELERLLILSGEPHGLLGLWPDRVVEGDSLTDESAVSSAAAAWRRGTVAEYLLQDPKTATADYVRAVQFDAAEGPWVRDAERALIQTGDRERLARFYDHINPRVASNHRDELTVRAARNLAALGDLRGAAAAYRHLFDTGALPANDAEDYARTLMDVGNTDSAIAVFEHIATQGRQQARDTVVAARVARALMWLGHLYNEKGDEDSRRRAVECYDELLRYRGGDPHGLDEQRRDLEARGDLDGLLSLLEEQADLAHGQRRQQLLSETAEIALHQLRDRQRGLDTLRRVFAEYRHYKPGADLLIEELRRSGQWAELAEVLLARAAAVEDTDHYEAVRLAFEAALILRERQRDDTRCYEALELVMRLAPGSTAARRMAADVLHRLGRFRELATLLEGWRLQPGLPPQHRRAIPAALAYLYEFHLDEPKRALELHQQELDTTSNDLASLLSVARLQTRLGEHVALVDTWRRLASVVTDKEDQIGFLLRAARTSEAMSLDPADDYTAILGIDPDCATARRGLERTLADTERHTDLLNYYLHQAKLATGAHRSHYLVKIAHVYVVMDRLDDARDILVRIVGLEPLHVAARFMLARVARKLGDDELLAQTLTELAETEPGEDGQVALLSDAATIYQQKLNDPDKAEPLLREILRIKPNYDEAYEGLRDYWSASSDESHRSGLLDVIDSRLEAADTSQRATLLREAARLAEGVDRQRALDYLDEILGEDDKDLDALALAGKMASEDERWEDAVVFISRFVEEASRAEGPDAEPEQLAPWLRQLGTLQLRQLEDPVAAVATFDRLYELDPDDLTSLRLLAEARRGIGDADVACQLLKDVFERQPTAELAIDIGRLLIDKLGRKQEGMAWFQRALDLDPVNGAALEGYLVLSHDLGDSSSRTVNIRVLKDRIDWLCERHLEEIQRDPWQIELFAQLAQLTRLRNDSDGLRDIAGVLMYFGAASEHVQNFYQLTPPGHPEKLLAESDGRLSDEDRESYLVPNDAQGVRSQCLARVWQFLAEVDPDSLKARGIKKQNRLQAGDGRLAHQLTAFVTALGAPDVQIYVNTSDNHAVSALYTPEPTLVVGGAIFEDPHDPLHHFRVARAIESLRDGRALLCRRGATGMLACVDELIAELLEQELESPIFGPQVIDDWIPDGARRLHRALPRRQRRELSELVASSQMPTVPCQRWLFASRCPPELLGMAVCGEFGIAADHITGRTFSLDREIGPQRSREVLAALRDSGSADMIEAILRFVVSDAYRTLRRRLGILVGQA